MPSASPPPRKWTRRFAELLREERGEAGLKLEDCPKGGSYQEECETTKKVPELKYLVRLMMWFNYKSGHEVKPERLRRLLIIWALARIEAYLATEDFRKKVASDTYAPETGSANLSFDEVWDKHGTEVLTHLQRTLLPVYEDLAAEKRPADKLAPAGKLPTLEMFPGSFKPLTVVVGGYPGDASKEPEQLAELFRHGQSFVDLFYLLRLGLDRDVEIVPDHLIIEMGLKERERILGNTHLLLIGGPLVNSLTRDLLLKKKLVFNHIYGKDTYRWDQVYDHFKETGIFDNPAAVRTLYQMLETPQEQIDVRREPFTDSGVKLEERERIKDLVSEVRHDLVGDLEANNDAVTEQFRPKEIFSPFRQKLISCANDEVHDWAVVTVGENPWASELNADEPGRPRRTVVAAFGSHEISTALAIKALGKVEEVRSRPLGGVLAITKARRGGLERIKKSTYTWATKPYAVQELLLRVKQAQDGTAEMDDPFSIFTREELADYKRLVELFLY